MSKQKTFRFVTPNADLRMELPSTRSAIYDAVLMSKAVHVLLYRVQDDDEEQLLFDSKKCKARTIDGVLKWAEKGDRS